MVGPAVRRIRSGHRSRAAIARHAGRPVRLRGGCGGRGEHPRAVAAGRPSRSGRSRQVAAARLVGVAPGGCGGFRRAGHPAPSCEAATATRAVGTAGRPRPAAHTPVGCAARAAPIGCRVPRESPAAAAGWRTARQRPAAAARRRAAGTIPAAVGRGPARATAGPGRAFRRRTRRTRRAGRARLLGHPAGRGARHPPGRRGAAPARGPARTSGRPGQAPRRARTCSGPRPRGTAGSTPTAAAPRAAGPARTAADRHGSAPATTPRRPRGAAPPRRIRRWRTAHL